jgi:hypothetical protein
MKRIDKNKYVKQLNKVLLYKLVFYEKLGVLISFRKDYALFRKF